MTANKDARAVVQTEREAFEAWALKTHGSRTLTDPDAGSMWSAWQARALLSQPAAQPEPYWLVEDACPNCDPGRFCKECNSDAAPIAAQPEPIKTDNIRSVPGGAAFLRVAAQPEPVAVIGSDYQLLWCRQDWSKGLKVGDKLYATPIAAQEAPPSHVLVPQAAEPRFQWCCGNGCGPCDTKRIEFEYERTETEAGEFVSNKTEPHLVSKCCGADLTMWDNLKGEEVIVSVSAPLAAAPHPTHTASPTDPWAVKVEVFRDPCPAAPAAPTDTERDAVRLDWMLANRNKRVQCGRSGEWVVLDCSNGLTLITRGHATARDAIDAAMKGQQ